MRQAAHRLGITVKAVKKLCAAGELTLQRRHGRWPTISLEQVAQLLEAGMILDPVRRDRISAAEASEVLGVSKKWINDRARSDRLPAVKDSYGQWWFRREQLELIAAARAARRDHGTVLRRPGINTAPPSPAPVRRRPSRSDGPTSWE